jgi:uncharacterized membrane protein
MYQGLQFVSGMGLGAGLMYYLDPDLGRRRRALLCDQLTSAFSRIDDCMGGTFRDLSQRTQGVLAETRAALTSAAPSDEILAERVRAHLERVVSHPASVQVTARQGTVTLSGPILQSEVDDLLACVRVVRGVKGVENRLQPHKQAGDIPGLQGGRGRPGDWPDFLQTNWAPATRLLACTAGGLLTAFGLTRSAPTACVLGTVGLGIFARGLTNTELPLLLGIGGGRRLVDVHKTLFIAAPVEEVFRFWANYHSFPRFMAHLKEVRDLGGGRSHWVAEGPAGVAARWDARLTQLVPNAVLAWRSEPGSRVANAGIIRLEPQDGGTRVDLRMSYNPPAGALGHLAALLFGADPKSSMDEDLVRLKSLLEEGKTRAAGQQVTRKEVSPSGVRS